MTRSPSFRTRAAWCVAALAVVATACERRITVYVDCTATNQCAGTGDASGAAGATAGASGMAGARDAGGARPDASVDAISSKADAACAVDADCPPPTQTCLVSRCDAGRCEMVSAPQGAMVPDVPADCHAAICDGRGQASSTVVDVTNVPLPTGACGGVRCTASGDTSTAPLAAGTACSAGARTGTCDGAGNCVECNRTADCPAGLFCDAHHFCGSAPCTDLDCGGACGPCGLNKRCLVDADCLSFACDAATTTCTANQCLDHRQDGDETDADCGGGACRSCGLAQACVVDDDCTSQACDVLSLKCILSQCADHRIDGTETDVDCGGSVCNSCAPGQSCNSNFDCQSGHFCGGAKICQ